MEVGLAEHETCETEKLKGSRKRQIDGLERKETTTRAKWPLRNAEWARMGHRTQQDIGARNHTRTQDTMDYTHAQRNQR